MELLAAATDLKPVPQQQSLCKAWRIAPKYYGVENAKMYPRPVQILRPLLTIPAQGPSFRVVKLIEFSTTP